MGLATARQLARSGCSVCVLEQFSIPNTFGSSHGQSRMLRLSYDEPRFVEAATTSLRLWKELELAVGQQLFHTTGALEISEVGRPDLESIRSTMVATATPFEDLDRKDVKERWPQFNLSERHTALFQPDGGILDAELCVRTLASEVERLGGRIEVGQTASKVISLKSGVRIFTDCNTYDADRVVLCAGGWVRSFLQQQRLGDLPVFTSTEQVGFFIVREESDFTPDKFPIFVYYDGTSRKRSGFPIFKSPGLKLMIEQKQDQCYERIDHEQLEILRDFAGAFLNGVTGDIVDAQTCLYTMATDEEFIVDEVPDHRRIIVASPCSGHGFKFAPLIATYLADRAFGRAEPKLSSLAPGGFTRV